MPDDHTGQQYIRTVLDKDVNFLISEVQLLISAPLFPKSPPGGALSWDDHICNKLLLQSQRFGTLEFVLISIFLLNLISSAVDLILKSYSSCPNTPDTDW